MYNIGAGSKEKSPMNRDKYKCETVPHLSGQISGGVHLFEGHNKRKTMKSSEKLDIVFLFFYNKAKGLLGDIYV